MTDTPSEVLIAGEVARWLRLRSSTVYVWAATQKIPSIRLNGAVRFLRADIQRWLNERSNVPANLPPAMTGPIVPPKPTAVSRQTIHRAGARALRHITGRQSSQQNSVSRDLPSKVRQRKDKL